MKNVYSFDFFFDADLANRGIIRRTPEVFSFFRWAAEEDEDIQQEQAQASRANVRDVFMVTKNYGQQIAKN